MAIYKIHHETNYTVISNRVLQDTNLSLKTIGLLCKIMGLPEGWDFSEAGLASISKDGLTVIRSSLKELEEYGYLVRTKVRDDKGRIIDTRYDFYENPQSENLKLDNLKLDNTHNKVNNNTVINNTVNTIYKENVNVKDFNVKDTKDIKHRYGNFKHVTLTDEQYNTLTKEFPNDFNDWINKVDNYCESKGKTYSNYLQTIRNWSKKDFNKKNTKNNNMPDGFGDKDAADGMDSRKEWC